MTIKNYSPTSLTFRAGSSTYTLTAGQTQAGISLADLDNVIAQGRSAPHGNVNIVGAGAFPVEHALLPITEAT